MAKAIRWAETTDGFEFVTEGDITTQDIRDKKDAFLDILDGDEFITFFVGETGYDIANDNGLIVYWLEPEKIFCDRKRFSSVEELCDWLDTRG